jgi:hypothetical protein
MELAKYNFQKIKHLTRSFLLATLLCFSQTACEEDILDEKPLDFLNSDVVLTSPEGFESATVGLYESTRQLYFREDGAKMQAMHLGTDVAITGDRTLPDFHNYVTWLTPNQWAVEWYWNWAYRNLLPRANTIIEYADREGAKWESEEQKNRYVAEARFFRAYAYNFLANLYGGVPIVEGLLRAPKTDFERASRQEVYEFARQDLEFASQWLPASAPRDGRISKAAADHLLAEVYISLGQFDKAVESATRVIEGGQHSLMTQRFGNATDQPGDVISDLHAEGNQNRSAGNLETIWNLQFEPRTTPGGTVESGRWTAVTWLRAWGPKWWDIKDPDGIAGMQVTVDSLGRGVGWVRPTDYFTYHVWEDDPTEMRNSKFNIRREYYYNNPASAYFGQKVDPTRPGVDTMVQHYPMLTKIEGDAELLEGATYGRAFKDVYIMRLAETYLLRAEAYLLNGQLQEAAEDINVVRARANAEPITAAQVDLDFVLDERARELIIEENRRLTLNRMGKLVERVRQYNPQSGSSIQEHHALFPIPQSSIDANIDKVLPQNPGY